MKKIIFILSLFISFNAYAQYIDDSIANNQPTEEDKVFELEQKLNKLEDKLELFSKGLIKSNAQASRNRGETNSPEILLDQIQFRQDRLEQNIKNYVNEIERLNNKIEMLTKKLENLNEDYKVRFDLIEKSKEAEPKQEEKQTKKEDNSVILNTMNIDPDLLYKDAMEFIKKGEYSKAEQNFKIIISKFPKHELAGNAVYWLGETYYVRSDYANAVSTFADGVKKYGDSQKGPDSLLKLGLSFKALKKNKEACTTFSSLPVKYKKASSDLISRAKKEASELKCNAKNQTKK